MIIKMVVGALVSLGVTLLFWSPFTVGNFPYKEIEWPKDDKTHFRDPKVVTEWWYFTGKLTANQGLEEKHFYYYVTLRYMRDIDGDIPTLDIQITDIDKDKSYGTSTQLEDAKLSSYTTSIHSKDFLLAPEGGNYLLDFTLPINDLWVAVHLNLKAQKPPLIVANDPKEPGLVGMGGQKNSFYYVSPRLSTSGTIQIGQDTFTINADPHYSSSIMEHQWGDFSVPEVLKDHPWIWMALSLSDGTDMNVGQFLHPRTGEILGKAYVSIQTPDGKTRYVSGTITEGKVDPSVGYPLTYTLEVEGKKYHLEATVAAQNLNDEWMGIMSVDGSNVLEPGASYAFVENTVNLKTSKKVTK